jgi:hypothetical protein
VVVARRAEGARVAQRQGYPRDSESHPSGPVGTWCSQRDPSMRRSRGHRTRQKFVVVLGRHLGVAARAGRLPLWPERTNDCKGRVEKASAPTAVAPSSPRVLVAGRQRPAWPISRWQVAHSLAVRLAAWQSTHWSMVGCMSRSMRSFGLDPGVARVAGLTGRDVLRCARRAARGRAFDTCAAWSFPSTNRLRDRLLGRLRGGPMALWHSLHCASVGMPGSSSPSAPAWQSLHETASLPWTAWLNASGFSLRPDREQHAAGAEGHDREQQHGPRPMRTRSVQKAHVSPRRRFGRSGRRPSMS